MKAASEADYRRTSDRVSRLGFGPDSHVFGVEGSVGWPLTSLIRGSAWRRHAVRLGWLPFLTRGSVAISRDL
jgi:hypothetical protein